MHGTIGIITLSRIGTCIGRTLTAENTEFMLLTPLLYNHFHGI
jgi:hypothetical protein